MKIIFSTILCLIFAFTFGQTKSYTTTKIAYWTLEKFPKHFLIKPSKVYTEKTKIGQLTFYQELNEYGQAEGLTVRVQKDYTSPHTIYYYRKGVVVYKATFFDRSSKADQIVNKSLESVYDGPQLKREFLANNELQEIVEEYKDGDLVNTNRPDNSPKISWNEAGLLNGKFKFIDDRLYLEYEGFAKNGELISLKETYMRQDIIETKIIGDTIFKKGIAGAAKGTRLSYKIKSRYKITNDENLKNKNGYFYSESLTDLPKVIEQMRLFNLPPFEDVASYTNNLLNGEFGFMKDSYDSYDLFTGKAIEGTLKTLTIKSYNFDHETGTSDLVKIFNYNFTPDSVYFTLVTPSNGEILSSDIFKINNRFKIGNSLARGENHENYYFITDISYDRINSMRYAK